MYCRGRGSPRARAAPGHPTALALGLTTAIILCCYLLLAGRSAFGGALSLPAGLGRQGLRRYGDSTAQTLVIYVFAHTGGCWRPTGVGPLCWWWPAAVAGWMVGAGQQLVSPTRAPSLHAHADPEYEGNLRFFLETGVAPDDGCDYLLVVQEAS